jgi:hypothetical protein
MEPELASAESQRVRAAPESSRECVHVSGGWPFTAQPRVLRRRVALRAGSSEAETASTNTDLFDGTAKAACDHRRRQSDLGRRLPQHRVFEGRPRPRRPSGREAERRSAGRDRVLGASERRSAGRDRVLGASELAGDRR